MTTNHPDHEPQTHYETPPAMPERRDPPPDDLDPALLEEALAAMRRYAETRRGSSAAFLAYLDLGDAVDPAADEGADFRDRYVGHFADRACFVRWAIQVHGWDKARAAFERDQGMWPDDLAWDEGVLWDHLAETYGLVERFGGVYAFRI